MYRTQNRGWSEMNVFFGLVWIYPIPHTVKPSVFPLMLLRDCVVDVIYHRGCFGITV